MEGAIIGENIIAQTPGSFNSSKIPPYMAPPRRATQERCKIIRRPKHDNAWIARVASRQTATAVRSGPIQEKSGSRKIWAWNQSERKTKTKLGPNHQKNNREKISLRVNPSKLTALRRNSTLVRIHGEVVLEHRRGTARRDLHRTNGSRTNYRVRVWPGSA